MRNTLAIPISVSLMSEILKFSISVVSKLLKRFKKLALIPYYNYEWEVVANTFRYFISHKSIPNNKALIMFVVFTSLTSWSVKTQEHYEDLPNIICLVSEDNSPFLGCYGDAFATTPNLDKLASDGFLYTNAYANAPVCAPARNTIITGVYANSGGHQNMRSKYVKSDSIVPFPMFLRKFGYYCTNNNKRDYNYFNPNLSDIWDDCSDTAHYKNKGKDRPFFAVFNINISHESSLHKFIPNNLLRHDPEQVPIPPYHPKTEEIKHDWAQYYDKVEDMDAWVGRMLKELDDLGFTENTIVIYYSDHGGVLARSKRFLFDSGTRVPFIVRIPIKYKNLYPSLNGPGSSVDRLISFVDFAPTMLSLAGIEIPKFMQGNAFLGAQKSLDPAYAFMFRDRMDERFDLSRSVVNGEFRYTRNYMPNRIYGQHLRYLWKAPSVVSWEKAYNSGACDKPQSAFWETKPVEEFYDLKTDPWEINNLANNPEYASIIDEMRSALNNWESEIMDTGFVPEIEWNSIFGNQSAYDYMRANSIDLESIIRAAEIASSGKIENLHLLKQYLNNSNPIIRYWGVVGLLILGNEAKPHILELKSALNDNLAATRIAAAEALYQLGYREVAENIFIDYLNKDDLACTFSMNSIDALNIDNALLHSAVLKVNEQSQNEYNIGCSSYLLNKWGIVAKK